MKAKAKVKASILLLLALAFACCTKEDRKIALVAQEKNIEDFILSLKADTVFYRGGSSRIVLKNGSGDSLRLGDSLYFTYAAYIFSRGKGRLFDTNSDSIALVNSWPISDINRAQGKGIVGQGEFIEGLENGFPGMQTGEYCYIIFNASHGYNNSRVAAVPKMSPLLFEIWADKIVKN